MKQTLQSILTASDAALFPDISKSCNQNSVLCITEMCIRDSHKSFHKDGNPDRSLPGHKVQESDQWMSLL